MKKNLLYGAIAIMTWLILYCTIDKYKAPTIEALGEPSNPIVNNPVGGQLVTPPIYNPPAVAPTDIEQQFDMTSFPPQTGLVNRISNNPMNPNKQYRGDSVQLEDTLPSINSKEIALLNRRMDGINSNKSDLDRMKRITESNSAAIAILSGAAK